jgi:hypothetical protein
MNQSSLSFGSRVAVVGILSVMSVHATSVEPNQPQATTGAQVYHLVTAAGRELPVVISENSGTGYKQEIIGASITLREDDPTFHWTTWYRYTEDRRVTTSESTGSGTYIVDEEEITLLPQPSISRLVGKLKGTILLLKADVELVYKRE